MPFDNLLESGLVYRSIRFVARELREYQEKWNGKSDRPRGRVAEFKDERKFFQRTRLLRSEEARG